MKRRNYLQASLASMLPMPFGATVAAPIGRLPIQNFAKRPLMEDIALSPDGRRIAAIVNNGEKSVLVTRAVAGGAIQTVLSTDNLESTFSWFRWLNNERLVVSMGFPSRRQINFVQFVPTTESRLLAVNADGSDLLNLVKQRRVGSEVATRWAVRQDKVVDFLPEDGKHVLLALPGGEREYEHAVYKVNCYTADRTHYSGTRENIYNWITDKQHRVRVGLGYNDQSESLVWVCDPDGKNWRELSKTGPFSRKSIQPLGFGRDPNLLYVSALHEGLQAVQLMDLREPERSPEVIYSDPRRDVGGSLVVDTQGNVVGIRGTTLGDSSSRFWNVQYKAWQQEIDEVLPNSFNQIIGNCPDGESLVVSSETLGRPESFFIFSMGSSPSMRLIAHAYPELREARLGAKRKFEFNARDGLEIHGYLTLPPNVASEEKLPMVIFPHGGPQYSDGPEFDDWVAFMADRGCAVLQVNFRGSTGYGQKFLEAGLRRWGLEMQDDLTDAVAAMIKRGIADPDRVAIVGASYGGYAALMGAVKTPTLYRGAFAVAAVTDLVEFVNEEGQYSARESVRRQIGDYRDDRKQLESTSPRQLAHKVQVPIVLIHGTHDRSVPHDHSVWMAEALKKHGKEHKFISQEKGDHYLSHLPYRLQVFNELEAFLDRVLATKPA